MSGRKKIAKAINCMAANAVLLLLVVALINRTSAQNNWQDYFAAKLNYHHVHHENGDPNNDQDFAQASSDHTDRPHKHGNGFDGHKHRHCHTHGNMHSSFGEPLFCNPAIYPVQSALLHIENHFPKPDELFVTAISSDHFRPPIEA